MSDEGIGAISHLSGFVSSSLFAKPTRCTVWHNYTRSEPGGVILLLMVFCPPPESWC